MSRNLAATYRPHRLRDIVGQRGVVGTLTAAVAAGEVPAQILLYGESGLGKTTIARALAAALLCENPVGGDSCGVCATCRAVANGTHPDVVEIDAASHGGIDQIRQIGASAQLAPLRGRWRVTIIDEAHGLSVAGIQAFLKVLEEPPAHCVFVLATTEPERLGATVRGRCLQLRVVRPSNEELSANLVRIAQAEGVELTVDGAAYVVEHADPGLGVRGTVVELERVLREGESPLDRKRVAAIVARETESVTRLLAALEAQSRREALLALREARAHLSEADIRRHVEHWAHQRLDGALAGGGDLNGALDDLERCLRTPPGVLWTDILVAGLAEPSLVRTADGLRQVIEEARSVGDALSAVVDRATVVGEGLTGGGDPYGGAGEQATPSGEGDEETVDEPGDYVEDEAAHTEATAEGARGTGISMTDLLNAVAGVNAREALSLRRGGLSLDEPGRHVRLYQGLSEAARAALDKAVREAGWDLAG